MIEVEIKLPLFRRSITERALTDCGFKAGNLVKESDFYFTSDFHDFMKTDEALRIRTCENFTTRETTSFLTYKGAKLDTVSTTRKELETRIEDADIAIALDGLKPADTYLSIEKLIQAASCP